LSLDNDSKAHALFRSKLLRNPTERLLQIIRRGRGPEPSNGVTTLVYDLSH
jgi:hypothetical protein